MDRAFSIGRDCIINEIYQLITKFSHISLIEMLNEVFGIHMHATKVRYDAYICLEEAYYS